MAPGATSDSLFNRASRVIPGGVNSPVRAFKGVGGTPLFIARGEGAYVFDADNRAYIDYVGSWGPLILGHAPELVVTAVSEILERGTSFGAPTELEVEFAELLTDLIPSLEMVRMVSSGTEATMAAVRLARGYTGRDLLVKFNGCYHGHGDSFLVQAGSGVATCGISSSPGVPAAIAELTLSIELNDLALLERSIDAAGPDRIAAIIIEPVAGNMGLVLPEPGYLQAIRRICTENGIVLIFDEVMTGFRVGLGGASERFQIAPDLLTFGKVIGGGLPVGAFGGRREIMEHLAPSGSVYQAGTLSGNPLAMSAGLAVLRYLRDHNPYPELERKTARLMTELQAAAREAGHTVQCSSCGSMFGFFFSETPVRSFADAKCSDIELFKRFFHRMLEEGVYLAPSAFEAGFLSTAHSDEIIDQTIAAARAAFARL